MIRIPFAFLRRAMVALSTTALLAGCQISPGWRDSVRTSIDDSLTETKAAKAVPDEVSKALLPPIEIALPEGKTQPLETRFDLAVSNAPARQVFMGLVEGTPYSMVLHPGVAGTLSLNLKNVTVPEAMSAIRQVYGYEFRREGERFFVLGREMQTRLFAVNYLNMNRKGKSDTRVVSGGGGQAATGASAGSGAGTSGSSSVEIETLTQVEFWKELGDTLKAIVGTEGGRKVLVNSQTGIVVVRAMPDDMRIVEEYLGNTHASVNRQVVLEAKVIEVELNDGFQAGINWAKIRGDYTFGQVGGGTALTGTGVPGVSEIAGNTGNLNPGGTFSAITGTTASAFGGVFTLAAKTNDFAAFVELLKAQGEVQVLSSPRVSTVNNQKAVIKVGSDGFFAIGGTAGTAATSTSAGSAGSVTLASFFSGIALDVTPQIDESNNILLHIHPAVSTVTQQDKTFSGLGAEGANLVLPLALSAIQESDNIVRAISGHVIVIGGLMKEGSTDENASVPLLGDIPILGNLFKHKKVTRIKKELVILLKPTVIQNGQDWNDAVGDTHERVKKIKLGS